MLQPLENTTWYALGSRQAHLNRGGQFLRYYPEDVCPFAGMPEYDADHMQVLEQELPAGREFVLKIASEISLPTGIEQTFYLKICQMILTNFRPVENPGLPIRPLGYEDVPQMLALTRLTKPGPFLPRTIDLGRYFGIFDDERLAAMAGERVRFDGFTELSAICTHPDYAGKGFASILTTHVTRLNLAEGITPFLHVRLENEPAIHVYQRLGFEVSRFIHYYSFIKKGP